MLLRVLRVAARNPQHVTNVIRAEYRQRLGIPLDRRALSGRSGFPINISVNLTRRCNLKCRMCTQHRHSSDTSQDLSWYQPDKELQVSSWINLMEQVALFRPTLYVTGGEPMLYPEFGRFIKEAKKRHFLVQMTTNGTLLARNAEMLVQHGVEIIMVSLDGPPQVHDAIRGHSGLFERTAEGIRALVTARMRQGSPTPVVGLNCTISKTNIASIPDMVAIASELNVDFLQFQHIIFSSPDHVARHNRLFSPEFAGARGISIVDPSIPEGEFYESDILPEDVELLAKNLELARRLARGRMKISTLPNIPPSLLTSYYLDLDYPFPGPCYSLWKTLRVMPDGSVSPCFHVIGGNIAEDPVREVWNTASMRNFRTLIAEKLLPGCARCCSRSFV